MEWPPVHYYRCIGSRAQCWSGDNGKVGFLQDEEQCIYLFKREVHLGRKKGMLFYIFTETGEPINFCSAKSPLVLLSSIGQGSCIQAETEE